MSDWAILGIILFAACAGWSIGAYFMYRNMMANYNYPTGKETRRLAQYQQEENDRWIRGRAYYPVVDSSKLSGTIAWPTVFGRSPYIDMICPKKGSAKDWPRRSKRIVRKALKRTARPT